MSALSLVDVCKTYKNGYCAVKNFNLEIRDNEFIIFVGPSGCGKSTTLRMIAGLEDISDGELWIDDQLMNLAEPKDRNLSMVFQNYALYPHMTIYDNMAFGLQVQKMDKKEIDRRSGRPRGFFRSSICWTANPVLYRRAEAESGNRQRDCPQTEGISDG